MMRVEEAYSNIAKTLVSKATEGWEQLHFHTKVLSKNCSAMSSTQVDVQGVERSFPLGMSGAFVVSDACIFLRDNLLTTTGERIWGLTFTLYPNGRFNIEYDYNKPEGYEETDETISLDEALKAISDSTSNPPHRH
jgi:hypothetical protein